MWWFSRNDPTQRPNTHGSAKLQCEVLEGRVMPAVAAGPPVYASTYERAMTALHAAWTSGDNIRAASMAQGKVEIDLDNDGWMDSIAMVNPPDASVATLVVSRTLPDGGLVTTQQVTLRDVAASVLAEDLDSDGLIDLFIPSAAPNGGTLLLGKGDGTFDVYQRDPGPIALAVGDVNGDGVDDFVFANPVLDRLQVQIGGGDLILLADGPRGMFAPGEVHLADLNLDGRLDLVVCTGGGNNVLILPGRGDGTFADADDGLRMVSAGTGRAHVAIAHLGDTHYRDPITGEEYDPFPDLIVASEADNSVTVFYNRGGFVLEEGKRMAAGPLPVAVTVGDANGDGRVDLVVTNRGDNSVRILSGLGEGLFHDVDPRVLPTGQQPVTSFVGDFDGDSRADLVSLNSGSNSLTFYPNVAVPTTAPRTIDSGGSGPIAGLAGDFNRDGKVDLVVAHRGDGRLTLFLGSDNGLTLAETIPSPGGTPTALAANIPSLGLPRIYMASDGSEGATLLKFSPLLDPDVVPPLAPDGDRPTLAPTRLTIDTELQALSAALSDLVPILVASLRDNGGPTRGNTARLVGVTLSSGKDPAGSDKEDEEALLSGEDAQVVALERFLLGVDEVPAPVVGEDGRTNRVPGLPEVTMLAVVRDGPEQTAGPPLPVELEAQTPAEDEAVQTVTPLTYRESRRKEGAPPDLAPLPIERPARSASAVASTSVPELMVVLGAFGMEWGRRRRTRGDFRWR